MEQSTPPAEEPSPNWFDLMGTAIRWKILGPEINNPFRTPLSDRTLVELAHRPNALLRNFNLRCMCEGYEVLLIRNLATPIFVTDHPCIAVLPEREVFAYLDRMGIMRQLEEEMARCREEIAAELKRREIDIETSTDGLLRKIRKHQKSDRKSPPKSGGSFRIVRM